jgi:hypothetical protein
MAHRRSVTLLFLRLTSRIRFMALRPTTLGRRLSQLSAPAGLPPDLFMVPRTDRPSQHLEGILVSAPRLPIRGTPALVALNIESMAVVPETAVTVLDLIATQGGTTASGSRAEIRGSAADLRTLTSMKPALVVAAISMGEAVSAVATLAVAATGITTVASNRATEGPTGALVAKARRALDTHRLMHPRPRLATAL